MSLNVSVNTLQGFGLHALPPADVYEDGEDVSPVMERRSNDSIYQDDDFSQYHHVLIAAIELAVKDCRSVFEKPGNRILTEKETVNAISAARFFLSERGDEVMEAAGFGPNGLKVARKLGLDTLRAIGIKPKDVFNTSSRAWRLAVGTNRPKWTRAFLKSKVFNQSRQGTFRQLLLAA